MPQLGGNSFEGVSFPVSVGDRYVHVEEEPQTGALVIDVYRWDRQRDRLVAELLRGRPVSGGSPLTVSPSGKSGGLRLGVSGPGENVVGYLSGGENPRAVLIQPDRILVVEGGETLFEFGSSSMSGFPVGIHLSDEGSFSLGCQLPDGFPERRLIEGATFALTDLVVRGSIEVARTDMAECTVIGPATMLPTGCTFSRCVFGPRSPNLVVEIPDFTKRPIGAIVLFEADVRDCIFREVAMLVRAGDRLPTLRALGLQA